MDTFKVTPAVSRRAQEILSTRLNFWMAEYLKIPGFADWKNAKMREQLLLNFDPDHDVGELEEFPLPPETLEQHKLITGYFNIASTLLTIRQTERYFRRYPFRNREVSREDHLKTCCELLFSRLYHFRERFFKHLVRLDRKTKPKNSMDIKGMRDQFEAHFKPFLDQRRIINHETGYSDVQLSAIGLSDMLSNADADFEMIRATSAAYRAVAASWAKKTRALADDLDLYVGFVAAQMLIRCSFLSHLGAPAANLTTALRADENRS